MEGTAWQVSGQYFETCNCDYLCPCVPGNLAARPTKGNCIFPMVFHVDQGRYGNVTLDGLNFAIIASSPWIVGEGNLSAGVILDERATPEQREALTMIASGELWKLGTFANMLPSSWTK